MQTVLVASSKGGCGKSALVIHLTALHTDKSRHVTVLDADPKLAGHAWCARRPDTPPGSEHVRRHQRDWQRLSPAGRRAMPGDDPRCKNC